MPTNAQMTLYDKLLILGGTLTVCTDTALPCTPPCPAVRPLSVPPPLAVGILPFENLMAS